MLDLPNQDYLDICKKGTVYFNNSDYDAAIQEYSKAIELVPDYPLAYIDRGIMYSQLRRFDDALADIDQAIDLVGDAPYLQLIRYILVQRKTLQIDSDTLNSY